MKVKWVGIAVAATVLMFSGQAGAAVDAAAFKALAKKKGCFNCHGRRGAGGRFSACG